MNVLVTGARGFLGSNLVENLKNLRDGKNRTRPGIQIGDIYPYDLDSRREDLERFCERADFVFHLAGVNRPKDPGEFQSGNVDLTRELLDTLERHGNRAPVMISSSVQATMAGRFGKSAYGASKKAGEEILFAYARRTGAQALVYRFPNLAGKWIRPGYNSAVATFCYNVARDLPIRVDDPTVEMELLFVEDLLEEMYDALEGHPHRAEYPPCGAVIDAVSYDGLTPRPLPDGPYCYAPVTCRATLGEIADLIRSFRNVSDTLTLPEMRAGSLEKKLFSMYLSYLPPERMAFDLRPRRDVRGSFTEILKTPGAGQFSVNVSAPGATKGEHWHNAKWELFIVVSGRALIRQRKIGTGEIFEREVSGEKPEAVYMLPGYTHSLVNLSKTRELVTLMWANEVFDPDRPDTYYEPVSPAEGGGV